MTKMVKLLPRESIQTHENTEQGGGLNGYPRHASCLVASLHWHESRHGQPSVIGDVRQENTNHMRYILVISIGVLTLLAGSARGEESIGLPDTQKIKVSLVNWTQDVTHLEMSSSIDISELPRCSPDGTPPALSLSEASKIAVDIVRSELKTEKVWCIFGQLIPISGGQVPMYGTEPDVYAYLIIMEVRDMPGAPTDRFITSRIVFMDRSTAGVNVITKPI